MRNQGKLFIELSFIKSTTHYTNILVQYFMKPIISNNRITITSARMSLYEINKLRLVNLVYSPTNLESL